MGISLVRNEDVYIDCVLRNIVEFCDRIIVADHQSTDATPLILEQLALECPKIEVVRVENPSESHDLVSGYIGSDTWVFGVDGDEIYDPKGLRRLRAELMAGAFADWWQVFGNVLNCVELDVQRRTARGYLAPPCRSMTKLYNFRAISGWEGWPGERMAGGRPIFRRGYDASRRLLLYSQASFEDSFYRCLHVCFLRRSSGQPRWQKTRPNIPDLGGTGSGSRFGSRLRRVLRVGQESQWKKEKYMRGPLATVEVSAFFPPI
ncbi:MAG: glycosyltransferase family 2 protein [Gemmatimonadetes bacterium]|nr:glycosyltransferase family 2 protein [Gemmatimonadota bacterium]